MTLTKSSGIRRFFRDPLFHFLIAGAVVYGSYYILSDPVDVSEGDEKTVVVSIREIEWLSIQWEKRWNRPPTREELNGLIDQHVRETVLYRQALSMGLDKDDAVIRRRLGQKLEFLSQDLLQPPPPSEEELRSFFAENQERYRDADRITLSHVFFNPDVRGAETLEDAKAVLSDLVALPDVPADVGAFGDRFLLQAYYPNQTEAELSRLFGSGFAEPVFQLEQGVWQGPVLSGYGAHLVFVHDHFVAPEPKFEDVQDQVTEHWTTLKRAELNEQFFETVLDQFTVVVAEFDDNREQDESQ